MLLIIIFVRNNKFVEKKKQIVFKKQSFIIIGWYVLCNILSRFRII